jgi:uncharacterized protein
MSKIAIGSSRAVPFEGPLAIQFKLKHFSMSKLNANSLSRRNFAAALAVTGVASVPALLAQEASPVPAPANQRHGTIDDVPAFQAPLEFRSFRKAPTNVEPFPMTQVRLLDGRFQQAAEWNRGYVQRLPTERLVRNFRLNAGLPSSAQPLGGWEVYGPGREAELRGHFTGHYLSACALMYSSTGDAAIKAKGDSIVEELSKCQNKLGSSGYLSAFPSEWFDRLDARKEVWAPFYTVHKIMAGMFDMYQLTGNGQALEVLEGMANWADKWSASKSEAHMQDILNTEYGGMNEVLYNLASATADPKWATAGDRFTKKRFFNPLVSRRDELRGLHANTHIPQVIGAARRYEISSDLRFHDVADFFWYEVAGARSYVTGGTSNNEGWLTPPRRLFSELNSSSATAECCCAYNMLKLTRHLYSWTSDPRYFDYYERVLLNHRLGTIRPQTGATQYYLSHSTGAWRTFGTEDKSFWCCTGSGIEEFSKLNDSIYWRDSEGIYVNLFIASALSWTEKGFHLRQETKFPEQASTTLIVTVDQPIRLAVRLRVPAWLPSASSVKINGKPVDASAGPGSYLVLTRTWNTGDRLEMELPMSLHMEAMPDDSAVQAAMYGPLVLAGDLGSDGLTDAMVVGPLGPKMAKQPLPMPALREPIQAGDQPLTFNAAGQNQNVRLAPLNTFLDKRYSIYWRVS